MTICATGTDPARVVSDGQVDHIFADQMALFGCQGPSERRQGARSVGGQAAPKLPANRPQTLTLATPLSSLIGSHRMVGDGH
jgi:hypothetical protein